MSKAVGKPYAEIVGLEGLEAYALNAAVVRWGSAFDAAIKSATVNAKNQQQAENKAASVLRRWVPSTRKYR